LHLISNPKKKGLLLKQPFISLQTIILRVFRKSEKCKTRARRALLPARGLCLTINDVGKVYPSD
jgi:hypothetical protein